MANSVEVENFEMGNHPALPLFLYVSFSLLFYFMGYSRTGTVLSIFDFPGLATFQHVVSAGKYLLS